MSGSITSVMARSNSLQPEATALAVAQIVVDRLRPIFGERFRGLVLYGSRARGDAQPDSDYDFLVLLDEVESFGAELERMSYARQELSLENVLVISVQPVDEETFATSHLPLFVNVRREGIALR